MMNLISWEGMQPVRLAIRLLVLCGLLLGTWIRAAAADDADEGQAHAKKVAKAKAKTSRVAVLPPAPDGVVIERDVTYLAPGRKEKLDLYLPASRPKATRSPAVVIIHGGGWSGGDKASGREFNIGTTLAKAGYVCASVEYFKGAVGRWPTNLYDCKNAVRFLRAHADRYQVDVDHVGVIGGSAGGHLALMVAYTTGVKGLAQEDLYPGISDRVLACVDMYGISDLVTRQAVEVDGTPNGKLVQSGLFADKGGPSSDTLKLASPVYHVSKACPPTLILHGLTDTTVDREQSVELDRKLSEQGVEHRLILIPGVGHTFDLQEWRRKPLPQDLRPVVTGFFDQHLRP